MIHFSVSASLLRRAVLSLCTVLIAVSAASAIDLDFNVASGNFQVATNWVDQGDPAANPPVPPAPPATPPTVADKAFVRNGGTLNISSADVDVNTGIAATSLELRIGYHRIITAPDYDGNGVVDASDYVLWRKGGPLLNDLTPATVGPEDYTLWRAAFGTVGTQANLGKSGTLNWTAGEITGEPPFQGPYSGGPDIRVGRIENVNGVPVEVPGTVVQNGPTTKLTLPSSFQNLPRTSKLVIGDGTVSVHVPTSSYTLMDGEIGLSVSTSSITGARGSSQNDGIIARNGTFNMTGGRLVDATHADYLANGVTAQRFLTIATATGSGVGNETVATANLSGGNINVLGGIRVATANNSRGYLNINGPITIVSGGDTQIGNQPNGGTNGVGEMNMSAGSFQVGRTDFLQPNGDPIDGRFHIGDQGRGTLNMTGGSINVTRNVVVANTPAAAGSLINMTGGTITTGGLEMRRNTPLDPVVIGGPYAASIIVDGPTASFITTGTGRSPDTIIGNSGKALFEVRQGNAVLGGGGKLIQLGHTTSSDATINVSGGKLTLGGTVVRTALGSVAPTLNFTGGTVEFNNTTTSNPHQFLTDFENEGSTLVIKSGALQQVQVGSGSPPIPANFAMTSGTWDLEIGNHSTTGADWFNVPNGTASFAGTINVKYILGYTPQLNDKFTILDGNTSTPTLGSVNITGMNAALWSVVLEGNDIKLQWNGSGSGAGDGLGIAAVPEPSTIGLFAFAFFGMFSAQRTRRARQVPRA